MKRKALFIGGTGTISAAVTRLVATMPEWELTVLNRGSRNDILPDGVQTIRADVHTDDLAGRMGGRKWDVVADFIAFTPDDVERDFRLFHGCTQQYLFISSASVYRKPPTDWIITESTPVGNPYSAYARSKIACEEALRRHQQADDFPVTIVRPTLTYDERKAPVAVRGDRGNWQVMKRMLEGKPVIIPGDGTSLWTLTHSSDFARGFAGLMGNSRAIGKTYNITSDETLTWNAIYEGLARALGVELRACHVPSELLAAGDPFGLEANLQGDKAWSAVFDQAKLRRVVPDFRPRVHYDQGIRETVTYILAHPECQQEDPLFDAWCDRVVGIMEQVRPQFKAAAAETR